MNHKIKDIMDWWSQFNKTHLLISTTNNKFNIEIKTSILPHLLGLQYTLEENQLIKGLDLFYFCYNKSDEEIFGLVRNNNVTMLQSISDRVDTFRYFMENLESGELVENTKVGTSINSQHFIIENKDNKILHLGLLSVSGENTLIEYTVIDKKLETYILANNDKYYKDSLIRERIISIEKYNEQGELEPFSFKEEEIYNDYGMDM